MFIHKLFKSSYFDLLSSKNSPYFLRKFILQII